MANDPALDGAFFYQVSKNIKLYFINLIEDENMKQYLYQNYYNTRGKLKNMLALIHHRNFDE